MASRRISRILVVNAHSQANAGDAAIVLGQLQLLTKLFPDARLTITSRTPGSDRPVMATWGVEVIAPVFHSPSGFRGRWRGWANSFLSLVFPRPALAFLRCLCRADLVFACGGGYFYSNRRIPGFTFWQNDIGLRLAILLRKDIVFFPQSYGPLASPLSRRRLAGLIASRRVRVVFAREAISLSVLQGLLPSAAEKSKLQFCPDMAFYFAPAPSLSPVDFSGLPRPRLALALRDWDFPAQRSAAARQRQKRAYIEGVLSACLELHRRHNASFLVFSQALGPSKGEDDRRISFLVHERLSAAIPSSHLRLFIPPLAGAPATIVDLLRQTDLLITSRMHAAIFAFLAGRPAAVIGYQHKSAGILESIDLGHCSLPIEEIQSGTLLRLCEEILKNREQWRERIARTIPGLRETIEEKFRVIFSPPSVWP